MSPGDDRYTRPSLHVFVGGKELRRVGRERWLVVINSWWPALKGLLVLIYFMLNADIRFVYKDSSMIDCSIFSWDGCLTRDLFSRIQFTAHFVTVVFTFRRCWFEGVLATNRAAYNRLTWLVPEEKMRCWHARRLTLKISDLAVVWVPWIWFARMVYAGVPVDRRKRRVRNQWMLSVHQGNWVVLWNTSCWQKKKWNEQIYVSSWTNCFYPLLISQLWNPLTPKPLVRDACSMYH